MSVSALPTVAMKTPEKSEKIPDLRNINNNMKDLSVTEKPRAISPGGISPDDVKVHTLTVPEVKGQPCLEFSDDTASDTQSGDVIMSENSGRMYESEDIVFDDDLSSIARSNSVDYLKEKAIVMLQEELNSARKELELKDEKCKELSTVRSKVEEELEELTASLFQEAHKMVHDANMKQYLAEKKVNEAKGEIEALQTEISALKSLVLTSTPANPNPQLHPQLIKKKKDVLGSPLRKHRRNRSDADTNNKLQQLLKPPEQKTIVKMAKEVDTVMMLQLSDWLKRTYKTTPPVNHVQTSQSETTSVSNDNAQVEGEYHTIEYETMAPVMSNFLQKIEAEDVKPCLTFTQASLSQRVLESVHNNTLTIEPVSKPSIQKCALSGVTICCKHRIKCGDADKWLPISQSCRTRIASVCDFLTYIRYIEQGLVKHSKEQIYWEINRLRREMALAKLGYYKEE